MSGITYQPYHGEKSFGQIVKVFSDGQRVGTIKPVTGGGFRYFPRGITNPARAGSVFQSITTVKQSLEREHK